MLVWSKMPPPKKIPGLNTANYVFHLTHCMTTPVWPIIHITFAYTIKGFCEIPFMLSKTRV